MTQYDDRELLRRVAEIEGAKPARVLGGSPRDWVLGGLLWNPLTSDAQAMALVKKYGCHISTDEEGVWDVNVPRRYGSYPGAADANLNRAIVRAVVAAKGEG